MTASACVCLALALACLPRPAAGRLRSVTPAPTPGSGRRARHLPTAALVAAGAGFGFATAGPAGALTGGFVAALLRRRSAARTAVARAEATTGEIADALGRIADELHAGAHPATALGGATADGPLAAAVLAQAAAAARAGDDVPGALRRGAAAEPAVAGDLDRIATSWALAERHGVPLADLLAGARSELAWRLQYGRRVRAQLAGPRATAAVLTALPGVGILLGQLLGADPLGVLRGGVLGQVLLVVGIGLGAAGLAWTDHILRSAVPT